MNRETLQGFSLKLIANLWTDLLFFIPSKELPVEIIDKISTMKENDLLDKLYILDNYKGPIPIEEERDSKVFLKKPVAFEDNIFKLLEKKSSAQPHEIDYVLEKYREQIECLYHITDWLNRNINQAHGINKQIIGFFKLQAIQFKKHYDVFIKHFCPKSTITQRSIFNDPKIMETYLGRLNNNLNGNHSNLTSDLNIKDDEVATKKANSKVSKTKPEKRAPLITLNQAEEELLKTYFNINFN